MELNYWQYTWTFHNASCPCDLDFQDYLSANQVTDKMIFHFGSGQHHILGRYNIPTGQRNEILAITASRKEYLTYIDFIVNEPEAANYYKVLFSDIYTLTPRVMPWCDFIALFHLCEFYDPEKSGYAHLNDSTLLELCLDRLNPGGKILFYPRSFAFPKAQKIIQEFTQQGRLELEAEYKTLLVYRQP